MFDKNSPNVKPKHVDYLLLVDFIIFKCREEAWDLALISCHPQTAHKDFISWGLDEWRRVFWGHMRHDVSGAPVGSWTLLTLEQAVPQPFMLIANVLTPGVSSSVGSIK